MGFEITSSFLITMTGLIGSGLGLLLMACLKSRCINVTCCWGMLNFDRIPIPMEPINLQPTGSTLAVDN
tara:strand:- start:112 stop:318 length:207 start_codon:yes stop_codon:yes gene_type:complete